VRRQPRRRRGRRRDGSVVCLLHPGAMIISRRPEAAASCRPHLAGYADGQPCGPGGRGARERPVLAQRADGDGPPRRARPQPERALQRAAAPLDRARVPGLRLHARLHQPEQPLLEPGELPGLRTGDAARGGGGGSSPEAASGKKAAGSTKAASSGRSGGSATPATSPRPTREDTGARSQRVTPPRYEGHDVTPAGSAPPRGVVFGAVALGGLALGALVAFAARRLT
jgi:hypothetical protein